MHQGMISLAGGKILLAKTNWFFHPKIQLFQNFPLHSLRSTCHSTCPLPQRVLLSKRTSRLYESCLNIRDVCAAPILREQSDFAILSVISSQETLLFSKIHDFHVPRLHHGETLLQLKLFAQPMDRAEVLHAPRYDISVREKNTPGENELVLSSENSTFPPKSTHMSGSTCHSTCPLP